MALTLRQLNHRRIDWMKAKALQINLSLFDKPKLTQQASDFNFKKINKILCLRLDDKLGDMVVSTILYRELKNAHPHVQIDVMSGPASLELLDCNPHIHGRIVFKKGTLNVLKLGYLIRRKKYDLVIDVRPLVDARTTYLLAQSKAQWILGVSRQKLNLMNLHLEEFDKNNHISHKYEKILKLLGQQAKSLHYDLFLTEQEKEKVKSLLPNQSQVIVLNPFAGARYRSLNFEKVIELITIINKEILPLNCSIFLMCPPQEKKGLQNLITQQGWKNVFLPQELNRLRDYVALISFADLVISPDTSAIHFASAFNKKILAFYRYDLDAPEINSQVWAPQSSYYQIVYAKGYNSEKSEIDMSTVEINDFQYALSQLLTVAVNEITQV